MYQLEQEVLYLQHFKCKIIYKNYNSQKEGYVYMIEQIDTNKLWLAFEEDLSLLA